MGGAECELEANPHVEAIMASRVGPRQSASVSPLHARLDSIAAQADNDCHASLCGPPPYRRPRPSSSWSRALVHGRTTRVTRRPRRDRPLLRMAWEGPFCFRPFAMHAGERSQRARAARGVSTHPFCVLSHVFVHAPLPTRPPYTLVGEPHQLRAAERIAEPAHRFADVTSHRRQRAGHRTAADRERGRVSAG